MWFLRNRPPGKDGGCGDGARKGPHQPRKRAVLVGIDYIQDPGSTSSTDRCEPFKRENVETVSDMFMLLTQHLNYKPSDIVLLTDLRPPRRLIKLAGNLHSLNCAKPTAGAILGALVEMVTEAKSGDTLFFMYCGVGGRIDVKEGRKDTRKGMLLPMDYRAVGCVFEDDLNAIALSVPGGVKFTSVVDAVDFGKLGMITALYSKIGRLRRASDAVSIFL